MSKRKNTEINAYIPIPEGQNDLLDDMKSIMYDEDIDFNLIAIDQDKDSKMELIYLNDDLKGCTHSDDGKNNSELKAMKRIDSGKINLLQTK